MSSHTQRRKIIVKLLEDNEVDNFWAINNYILRLGAIICQLKKEGWDFRTGYGKKFGYAKQLNKNYYYILKDIPFTAEIGMLRGLTNKNK
jgi:hypothetical protein